MLFAKQLTCRFCSFVKVAWRDHVFLEVTQIRYIDEDERIPGPAMAAGLLVGECLIISYATGIITHLK